MNESKKIKSLTAIVIFLLITNIAMLIFFVTLEKPSANRQRTHEPNGLYMSLKNEVGFSQAQLAKYQLLKNEQLKQMRPLFNQVRDAKKDFYGLTYSANVSDSLVNGKADSIAQNQKKLDMQMFLYFRNIRNICTAGQTNKFDSAIEKVVTRMVSRPPKHGGENKK